MLRPPDVWKLPYCLEVADTATTRGIQDRYLSDSSGPHGTVLACCAPRLRLAMARATKAT